MTTTLSLEGLNPMNSSRRRDEILLGISSCGDCRSKPIKNTRPGGVGLELLDPPPGFRELLARELALAAELPEQAAPVETFRVRVRRRGGSRYRTLTVQAESVQGARACALERVGSDWEIGDEEEA